MRDVGDLRREVLRLSAALTRFRECFSPFERREIEGIITGLDWARGVHGRAPLDQITSRGFGELIDAYVAAQLVEQTNMRAGTDQRANEPANRAARGGTTEPDSSRPNPRHSDAPALAQAGASFIERSQPREAP